MKMFIPASLADPTADDATLAAMKSWVTVIDYDGEDHTLIDLGTPTISSSSDALTSSGITSPTYYVDGVAGTALSPGKRLICVTTSTATDCGPVNPSTTLQTRPVLGYDVELTASEVLKVHNIISRRYTAPSLWLLFTGYWYDTGRWVDTETWNDGEGL